MFIVHNLTSHTVILSDLKLEIPPKKLVDLEKITDRSNIEKSRDLKQAFSTKRLALTRHSIIQEEPEKSKKHVEKSNLDESKLVQIIKKAVSEELKSQQPDNRDETISKVIKNSLGDLVNSIRDKINSVQVVNQKDTSQQSLIDPGKLAEISQKSIEKMSENIETNNNQKAKKITIINKTNPNDLAGEL